MAARQAQWRGCAAGKCTRCRICCRIYCNFLNLTQLLALYGCLTAVHLSSRPDYILVIDCGSTGTRM